MELGNIILIVSLVLFFSFILYHALVARKLKLKEEQLEDSVRNGCSSYTIPIEATRHPSRFGVRSGQNNDTIIQIIDARALKDMAPVYEMPPSYDEAIQKQQINH